MRWKHENTVKKYKRTCLYFGEGIVTSDRYIEGRERRQHSNLRDLIRKRHLKTKMPQTKK